MAAVSLAYAMVELPKRWSKFILQQALKSTFQIKLMPKKKGTHNTNEAAFPSHKKGGQSGKMHSKMHVNRMFWHAMICCLFNCYELMKDHIQCFAIHSKRDWATQQPAQFEFGGNRYWGHHPRRTLQVDKYALAAPKRQQSLWNC